MSCSPLSGIMENRNCLQESWSRLCQQRCTLSAVKQDISNLSSVCKCPKPHPKIMVFSIYFFKFWVSVLLDTVLRCSILWSVHVQYKKARGTLTAKKSRTWFLQIHTTLETSNSVTAVAVLRPPVLSQHSWTTAARKNNSYNIKNPTDKNRFPVSSSVRYYLSYSSGWSLWSILQTAEPVNSVLWYCASYVSGSHNNSFVLAVPPT